MKYFIGTTSVENDNSSYESHALFKAVSEQTGLRLLETRTAMFGGDDGVQVGPDCWSFSCGTVVCKVGELREIPPVAFEALKETFLVFQDKPEGDLVPDEFSENVKTVAHRLGVQLKRMEIYVPHGKLLNAVAASFGDTNWAVVMNKKVPSAEATATRSAPSGVTVTEKQLGPGEYQKFWSIEGFVDGVLVISMNNHVAGEWRVSSNMSWLVPLSQAERYHACVAEVLARALARAEERTQD